MRREVLLITELRNCLKEYHIYLSPLRQDSKCLDIVKWNFCLCNVIQLATSYTMKSISSHYANCKSPACKLTQELLIELRWQSANLHLLNFRLQIGQVEMRQRDIEPTLMLQCDHDWRTCMSSVNAYASSMNFLAVFSYNYFELITIGFIMFAHLICIYFSI